MTCYQNAKKNMMTRLVQCMGIGYKDPTLSAASEGKMQRHLKHLLEGPHQMEARSPAEEEEESWPGRGFQPVARDPNLYTRRLPSTMANILHL